MQFVLSGYYGFSNAGDEAVLAGALAGLRKAGVDARVLSARPELTGEQHGVPAFRRNSLREVREALRGADLFLSGGGGLLQDSTSLRSLAFYVLMMRMARMRGVPTMIFAQGIGPLKRGISRMLVRREANAARCITVRDEKSRELLQSIGVAQPVHVTADLSFLMEPPDEAFTDSVWNEARLDSLPRPVIATALRPWGSSDWVSEIAAGLDDAARRLGGSVVLLPFQRGVDDPLAASVADGLTCAKEVVKFEATPLQLLALISRSDVLLGMRLHSLIFAVMSGVPCVAVSYDPKVDAFAEQATLPRAVSLGRVSSAALSSAMVDCWNAKGEISHRLKASCESLRGRAQRNVRLALSAAAGGD